MRSQSGDYRLGGGLLLTHLHEVVGLLSAQKLPSEIAGAAKVLTEELEQVSQPCPGFGSQGLGIGV